MAGCFLIMIFSSGNPVFAHHVLPKHNLKCSKNFPCPKELERRIDFWIQVFKGWDSKTAIFHDPEVPERVYSVVRTGDGCSRRVAKKIKKERKKIKTGLYNAAAKVESGASLNSGDVFHFSKLFPSGNPSQMRRAAENIRCQSGVKDSFLAGLQRFNRYSYLVDTVMQQYGLPPEIRYLPFVESSYNPAAYSKAGAAGMWQIMPRTARTLGLELDATLDERLDPEAATRAAARYLVKSRNSLTELARSIDPNITDQEINPFVITSYNYGLNGMRRAIRAVGPDYLSVLQNYKSPKFQIAVKNFYSSFLAARHVTINAQKYFENITKEEKIVYQAVVLKNAASVVRIKSVFSVSESELKLLNLGLTRFIWHGWRMIPAGYQLKLPHRSDGYKTAIAKLESLAPETVAPGSDNYVVRKGDTACGISRALKVNCRELININRLGKKAVIRVGQKLVIPRQLVVVSNTSSNTQRQSDTLIVSRSPNELTYRVKRGDTACAIAEKLNVNCRLLISVNQLGRKANIYIGQKLIVPGTASQTGLMAALDENNRYLVRKGDFACSIASRFSVNCSDLKRVNRLNKKATIFPGQKLIIPGLEVPDTTETVEQLARLDQAIAEASRQSNSKSQGRTENPELSNLLDTLPDLSISITGTSGNPIYQIRIEADETLGHYSDWLGTRSTNAIRKLNKMRSGDTLRIGRTLKLPITSGNMVVNFEQKRIEYHQVLSESLKEHYTVVGIEQYSVRSGDSIWSLSRQSGFPVWLLYRLNPELKISSLRRNQVILLPKLQEN